MYYIQGEYFTFDDGNWLETLANNTKIQIGGVGETPSHRFHGSLSCFQIYNIAMNEAEMITKKSCSDLPPTSKASPCPHGFIVFENKCIKVVE